MTARVSSSTDATAPKASTIAATAASRSTSLTRSSPTSVNTVVPSATAAATASAGTSSRDGISLAGTSVPRRGPDEAVMETVPSPSGTTATAAPIL